MGSPLHGADSLSCHDFHSNFTLGPSASRRLDLSYSASRPVGELGEISAGKKKGRVSEDEITLFDSTGLVIQDVACAWTVYKALKNKRGLTRIALF